MSFSKTEIRPNDQTSVGIAEALFSKARQRVLAVLFGNAGRSFYTNEIIQLASVGTGAVQRELARLASAGIVKVMRVGNQKHYQANPDSPVFDELKGLVVKTSGICDVLRRSLEPILSRITAAFVYGSVAKGEDTADSDIDLMVVSDSLTYPDLFEHLEAAGRSLGRSVNPTIYTRAALVKRLADDVAFVTRVIEQPKLWVIGTDDELPA